MSPPPALPPGKVGLVRLTSTYVYPDPGQDAITHGCPGADGCFYLEILIPCQCSPPCTIVCPDHPNEHHHYERQPFSFSGPRKYLGATPEQIAKDEANIWHATGTPPDRLTSSPSFLGEKHRPYRIHSYVREGRLEVLGDSTVVLDTRPARDPFVSEEPDNLKRGETQSDSMTPPYKKGRHSTPGDITGETANPESVNSRLSSPSPEATEASPPDGDTAPGHVDEEIFTGSPPLEVDDPRKVAPEVPEGWTTAPHGDVTLHICPHKIAHVPGVNHSPCDGCCTKAVLTS